MADTFLLLPAEDRREALSVAADRSGRQAHLLKKDAWMVWALATLYGSPLGEHLVFKCSTSLSKAYRVIWRFSEDVDLTYDIRKLASDLVGDSGEALPKTRSEEKRWTSELRKRMPEWVAGAVQSVIAETLACGPYRRRSAPTTRSFSSSTRRRRRARAMWPRVSCSNSARAQPESRRAHAMSPAMLPGWWTAWSSQPRGRESCTLSGP
jgi:hypothetical protein